MSSIPLPALAVKDQQQNPLDTYAKGVALQGLLANQQQQQQLRPLQLQEVQNQLQLQQNQLDDAKRAVALRNAMNYAYSNAVVQDPATGQPSINGAAVVQHLTQAGQGAAVPEVQKSLDAFNKSHAELQELTTKNQQASLDYFANMAHAVKVANYDPVVASTFLGAMAHQAGPYQQQAQATLDHIQQDPSSIKPFVDQIEQASEKQRQAASAETTASARLMAAQKQPAGSDEKNAIQDYLEAHNLPDTAQNRLVARADYIQRNKVNPQITINAARDASAASAGGHLLSDDATDLAARNYLQTGELPRNYRAPGMMNAIINRAAQLEPDADIAGNKAVLAANRASLTGLQKQSDALKAFESTGLKNLDLFLQKAGPIVDSGSPWINTPLRAISKQGLGNADMAAYDAARTVATTEMARVLNNPALSGQLTDTARKEMESAISPNATLQQQVKAAEVLKQDAANRRQSYDAQISDVQSRIRRNSSGNSPNTNWKPPADAPPAPQEDNHTLKKNGVPIAVSKGGQWVQP